jgi:hypothetical protein
MSGGVCYATRPRDPLALHLAVPNRVLGRGPCTCTVPRSPCGRACAAILLCDLNRMAARAHSLPAARVPFRSPRRAILKSDFKVNLKLALRSDARRGPATMAKPGRGSERASSHWLQGAQRNRSAGMREAQSGDSALHRPLPSTRFIKAD